MPTSGRRSAPGHQQRQEYNRLEQPPPCRFVLLEMTKEDAADGEEALNKATSNQGV